MSIESLNARILEYKVKNTQNSVKEFYLNYRDAHDAEKRIKMLYGENLLFSRVISGTEVDKMYDKLYGIKNSNISSSNEKGSPVLLIVLIIVGLWFYFK